MKIVVAPDSFKGSLSAVQACAAITAGLRRVAPDAEIESIPMADGGEGTVEALVAATSGRLRQAEVIGPLGNRINATYGILGEVQSLPAKTAVIEMAAAAGLTLVPVDRRNPLNTTTYGVGQLILNALEHGCRNFIIALGGSATNDCGTGMAQALGVKFFDREAKEIISPMTGHLTGRVGRCDCRNLHRALARSKFIVACDVDNPLLGPQGASLVYGPQKGADENSVKVLEDNMTGIIGLIEDEIGREIRSAPGAGAAGGLGAALSAFLNARLETGIEIVMRYSRFAERISQADLIITGEGQIDGTTVFGKTIAGIAGAAAAESIPVIALAGSLGHNARKALELPITAMLSICRGPVSLETAMREGGKMLADAAEQAIRLILIKITDKT